MQLIDDNPTLTPQAVKLIAAVRRREPHSKMERVKLLMSMFELTLREAVAIEGGHLGAMPKVLR